MEEEIIGIYYEASIKPAKPAEQFEGREWEVTIIGKDPKRPESYVEVNGRGFIRSLNDRLYAVEGLRDNPQIWEGAKVYDNHLTQEEFERKQGMRSPVNEWLGTIVSPFWEEASIALKGVFKVVEADLAAKLKAAWEQGVLDTIGLSIDTFPIVGETVMLEGRQFPIIEGFKKILSVDLVGDPAAGGGFNRLIASVTHTKTEVDMTPEELKALLKEGFDGFAATLPQIVKPIVAEALAAEQPSTPEAEEAEEEADTQEAKGKGKGKKKMPMMDDEDEMEESEQTGKAEQALKEAQLARCELLLERKVTAAKLPEAFVAPIRQAFSGRVFKEAELDAMIKSQKEAQASQDPTGRAQENGNQRGQDMVIFSEADKQAMMFTRKIMQTSPHNLAKIEQNQEHELVKPRLFEAYNGWVKAGKPNLNFDGRLSELIRVGFLGGDWTLENLRYSEALNLATVIKNTVNIMVALDYMGQNLWYEPIVDVIETDNPIDDVTLARLFGAEALDVVAKGAPYTEMTLQDEEETASHVKQGNYVAVHLEDLLADKINYFVSLPSRLADAWSLTLSAKVAGLFTTNTAAGPVLSDSGALFNATAASTAGGHANLLTTALSWGGYDAVITAMLNQTSRPLGAGRKLTNMGPFYLLHPNNLRATANAIRNTENVPGTANLQNNPYGPAGDLQRPNLVNVPDWTDTNDWATVARYNGMSPIKLVFPRGGRTPEIFVADAELAGAMFTNDTIRYKLRMMTYRFSATYDVAPVTDWRLLHKNNVT